MRSFTRAEGCALQDGQSQAGGRTSRRTGARVLRSSRVERSIRGRTYTQWLGELGHRANAVGRLIRFGEWTVLAWEAGEDPAEFLATIDLHVSDEDAADAAA